MRKLFFILCMAICSVCLTSCGDDDKTSSSGGSSTDGSGSTIVDGVHVNPRKLLTLDLYKQDKTDENIHFAMSYDSKGRLSKVNVTTGKWSTELLDIDYDLKLLSCWFDIEHLNFPYETESLPYRFPFALNKYGFISRISNCELSYNDSGYLTGANTVNDMWTFAYNEGDIIKYMAETLKTGNLQIYYVYYSEKNGELYFTVNSTNKSYKWDRYWSLSDLRTVSALILYHAGLFGNISKHSQNLSAYSNKGAVIEQSDINNKVTVHCSFKIE